jgi:hypothetical protein
VLGAGALVVIGVLFWRRSRQFSATREAQMPVDPPRDAHPVDAP